jgi:hypothetical protein
VVGLTGCRVLIVDDDEDEVLDLVRALWKKRIPALYLNPSDLDSIERPFGKLTGIRLAFLDMDIIGGGVDSKSKVSALANFLRNVVDVSNGPYVAVAWTKHTWLVQEMDSYIFSVKDVAKPIALVTIAKDECRSPADGVFDLAALSARIDEQIQAAGPLRLLQAWEQCSIQAASEVVGELSAIASDTRTVPADWRQAWRQNLLRVMHTCGKEFVGEPGMSGGAAAYKAFCHSLIPLHADKLERGVSAPDPDLSAITGDLLDEESKADCGPEAKARINSMLHCSFDDLGSPQAGSVYLTKSEQGLSSLLPDVGVTIRSLIAKGQRKAEEYEEVVLEASSKVTPVLVEASPSCDHVQGRLIVPRLIGGFIAPAEVAKLFKSSRPASFWELGPLWLSVDGKESATYALVLNCLLVTTCEFPKLRALTAIFRIRSQAFSTLQACFASHAARPGMLLLR